jgi:hypothetical protein
MMLSRRTIFYRTGQFAGLVLVASWWWLGGRQMNYIGFSRTPLPQFGQIVPVKPKGIVVYITTADAALDQTLRYVCIGSGIIVAICLVMSGELSKMLNPPKPPLPPEL